MSGVIGNVSSFAGMYQLGNQIQSMTGQLNQVTGEISSGEVANPAGALGDSAPVLYNLQLQNDEQNALQTSTTTAGQVLDTIQTALTGIASTAQSISNDSLEVDTTTGSQLSVLATQAQQAMSSVIGALNTQFDGTSVFSGDSASPTAMQAPDATGGPTDTINAVLNAAVTANGGPLTSSTVGTLISNLNAVFSDSSADPSQNYSSAFSTASTDNNPTTVLVGVGQTVQYTANANQPAFRDLMQGLSMLSMLGAPSSQLDDTAKSALQTQANTLISQAQSELTTQQGLLGVTQSTIQNASNLQQSAASATQQQIAGYEQANSYADSTELSALQTQLQASYEVTAQISQLSLTHYFPSLT